MQKFARWRGSTCGNSLADLAHDDAKRYIFKMAYTHVIDTCDYPSLLNGRTIRALEVHHTVAALLLDTGETISFATQEVDVGKWFEACLERT